MTGGSSRATWRRPAVWAVVAALTVSLAMVAFSVASFVMPGSAQLPDRPDELDAVALLQFPLALGVLLSYSVVGAILAVRRPGNPIGWMILVIGMGYAFSLFTTEYVGRSVALGANLPGYRVVDWMSSWVPTVMVGLAVMWVPLLFPDGHLPSPRWRPFAWLAAIGFAAQATTDARTVDGLLPNPIEVEGPMVDAIGLLASAFVVGLLLAILAVIVRYRRSRGAERQQLKWFLAAAGYLALALPFLGGTKLDVAWYLLEVGLIALPIAIGIAILRYRLYDIDRLISRTIGWALVTGILGAVFVAIVLALQALLAGFTQGETLAVAASTLAAFALFQPLRRRVQVAVDRRFDRARYDGQRTVDAFAEELRDKVEYVDIDHDLHRAIHDTVRPAHVGVWLRERQGAEG